MAGRLASKNKENTNKENLLITRRRRRKFVGSYICLPWQVVR
jgi:hypothetical protein